MNLSKKKKLAKKVFGVGKDRIVFLESRIEDIKNAITKQDIRDLEKSGAIIIKEKKGRKKIRKKKNKSVGNVRKKVRKRKRDYIKITRKLRKYLFELYSQGKISKKDFNEIRKRIKNREFRSKAHMKEFVERLGGKNEDNKTQKKRE